MDQDSLKIRHQKSVEDYPHLNLKDGEFVELEFTRATICTVLIWIIAIFAAVLLTIFLAVFNSSPAIVSVLPGDGVKVFVNFFGFVLFLVIGLAALISTKVFSGNRLYVTNMRAIQYVRMSLFGNSVNIIDLKSIEDVSFRQSGLLEHVFGIGTIRMSTVGDETTYTFKLAYKPTRKEMSALTNLVSKSSN